MLPTSIALTLFILGASAVLLLGVWSWRRLWRHPITDSYSTSVYRHGVRGFGGLIFLAMTVVVPFVEAGTPLGPTLRSNRFWGDVVMGGAIAVPIALWGGYWWGRAMAWLRDLRPSAPSANRRPQN
jgi:hypothetical protein